VTLFSPGNPSLVASQVRFFGKFFGINSDYYVFEATLQEEGEAPEEGDPTVMPAEEPGSGSNAYTYFVCSQLGGPCTKLPPTTPSQIKVRPPRITLPAHPIWGIRERRDRYLQHCGSTCNGQQSAHGTRRCPNGVLAELLSSPGPDARATLPPRGCRWRGR
jgi:hypothetical protein